MEAFSYECLSKAADSGTPYRGTKNKYPLFDRKYSRYNFTTDMEDGNRIFHINNGEWWERYFISKEEYDSGVHGDEAQKSNFSHEGEKYWIYKRDPHRVGTVRPDNTIELTANSMPQSDRMFFWRVVEGWVESDVRRGGVIYRQSRPETIMFPLVKGMRLTCEKSPKPVGNYQLFTRRVNRKMAKDVLKKYEDFYRISYAMMRSMPYATFIQIAVDECKRHGVDTDKWWCDRNIAQKFLHTSLDTMIQESPLDAAAFFCAVLGIDNTWWAVARLSSGGPEAFNSSRPMDDVFNAMQRRLNDHIYRTHPGALKEIELEFGKRYPSSVWGHKVYKDGLLVEQLSS